MTQSIISDELDRAIEYLDLADQKEIINAKVLALQWHEGQMRESGEPYVTHPIAVAVYLAKLHAGKDTLIAALLHDVIEDERATRDEVSDAFGATVLDLVEGVTKLSKLHYEGKREKRQIASLRKMLLSAHDDLRVIFIKLADRWHNIQTIESLRPDKQERIARETLEIYVPFARLFGLWDLKAELEDICFPIVYPNTYKEWEEKIEASRTNLMQEREEFIGKVNAQTESEVHAYLDMMTSYEIYQKLQGNIDLLNDVSNIDTVHILIESKDGNSELKCYEVLGEIHKLYPVLTGSFRDYISTPQPNGYRAVHTTIFLSQKHLLRLRIQTQTMHDTVTVRKLSDWRKDPEQHLQDALSALRRADSSDENYIDDLKNTVLTKRIHIFTTMGEIVPLPPEATGVDFAFAVNPSHIRYLREIEVNGEKFQPTHVLQDGDTVELILDTSANKNGNKHLWLEKVKSVEAREGIKKSLKRTSLDSRGDQAKQILGKELQKQNLPSKPLFKTLDVQNEVVEELQKDSFATVLSEIATGILPINLVVDAYKTVIINPKRWKTKIMSFFGILPQSRILDKSSKVIDIEVHAKDRPSLIHDITRCFAQRDINLAKFRVFATANKGALYKIRLEAKNFDDFSNLYDSLLQVPDVIQVLRKK